MNFVNGNRIICNVTERAFEILSDNRVKMHLRHNLLEGVDFISAKNQYWQFLG